MLTELPRQIPRKERQQLKILGLNHTDDYKDGELEDCVRISAARYPYITTSEEILPSNFGFLIGGMVSTNNKIALDNRVIVDMVAIEENVLYITRGTDDNKIHCYLEDGLVKMRSLENEDEEGNAVELTDLWPKHYAKINSKLCIFPDGVMIDFKNPSDRFERIGETLVWKDSANPVTFRNTSDGKGVIEFYPALYTDFRKLFGDRVTDPRDTPDGWDESNWSATWSPRDGVHIYIRIQGTIATEDDGKVYEILSVSKRQIKVDQAFTTTGKTSKNITSDNHRNVIITEVSSTAVQKTGVSVLPALDYLASKNNRIYGCSNRDKTIYVSALGDPTDWTTYEGADTDAYAVAVDSDGDFTGCLALAGYVIFTKQHCIHKLLGDYPSEFYLQTIKAEGAREGCSGTLVNCNEMAVYVGEHGVYTYAGGGVSTLSKALETTKIKDGTAMFDGKSYWLSCKYSGGVEVENADGLFQFDLEHGIWLRREYLYTPRMIHVRESNLLLVEDNWNSVEKGHVCDMDSGVKLKKINGWEMKFKPFIDTVAGTYNSVSQIFEKKRYTRIFVRAEVPEGSTIEFYLSPDESYGNLRKVGEINGSSDGVSTLVMMLPRWDKVVMNIMGKGPATILAIEREYQRKESHR